MITNNNIEKLKLMPFLWLIISLMLGISLGWWALFFVLLLYYKPIRIYVIIAIVGSILNNFLHLQNTTLPLTERYRLTCKIDKSINKESYAVKVLSCYSINDTLKNYGRFNSVLEFYEPIETKIHRYDTIETDVYVETITKTTRDKSNANNLLNRGYTQKLIALPKSTIKISRYALSKNRMATLRLKIQNRLSNLINYSKNAVVLQRMITGQKSQSSKKEELIFRRAGISHILAISGLHIGVMFMILNMILLFMDSVFILKIVKLIAISIFMFLYVWFVDFQPSALRAVVMFTFLSFGTLYTQNYTTKYNILFGTAFIMLLIDSTLLYDVGFQLSFTAVAAILYGLSKYRAHFNIKNRALNYLALSCVVTISAQIATFPLILYHFGEFSTISLFSNLIIAPLVTPLLIFALAYIVVGSTIIGQITCHILDFMIYISKLFTSFNYSYFRDIEFTVTDLWATYLAYFLILLYVQLEIKEKKLSLRK